MHGEVLYRGQCGTEEDDNSTVASKSLGKANKEVSEVNFIDFFFSGAAAKTGLSVEEKIEFLEHVSFTADTLTS